MKYLKTVNCPSLESFPNGVPFSWKIPHVFAASNLLEIARIESGLYPLSLLFNSESCSRQ